MSPLPPLTVPADVDVEDRVVGALTVRRLAYAAFAASGPLLATTTHGLESAAVAAATVLSGGAGLVWRPGGRPLDRWVVPVAGYLRRVRPIRARHLLLAAAAASVVAGGTVLSSSRTHSVRTQPVAHVRVERRAVQREGAAQEVAPAQPATAWRSARSPSPAWVRRWLGSCPHRRDDASQRAADDLLRSLAGLAACG